MTLAESPCKIRKPASGKLAGFLYLGWEAAVRNQTTAILAS